MERVREDFDRLALLCERHGDGAGGAYRRRLLGHLPPDPQHVLEVGCGAGAFTGLLAARARRVTALDLSPQMLRLARSRTAGRANVDYVLGDVMRLPLPAGAYDCVVSIATLHHLPLARALGKMKDALRPGGVLVVHDLLADAGLFDRGLSALAYPLSVLRRLRETGRVRTPPEVKAAWAEHGRHETYLTLPQVKEMRREHLPAARIERHLFWRYTVIWRKPAGS